AAGSYVIPSNPPSLLVHSAAIPQVFRSHTLVPPTTKDSCLPPRHIISKQPHLTKCVSLLSSSSPSRPWLSPSLPPTTSSVPLLTP
ncbi:hypothetical protein BO79DRAFT_284024, partial [Aspergillus costaricaensis CBS 115574]